MLNNSQPIMNMTKYQRVLLSSLVLLSFLSIITLCVLDYKHTYTEASLMIQDVSQTQTEIMLKFDLFNSALHTVSDILRP